MSHSANTAQQFLEEGLARYNRGDLEGALALLYWPNTREALRRAAAALPRPDASSPGQSSLAK